MAIKEITHWTDPIWNKQEEESERANFYFDQFKNTTMSPKEFKEAILEEVQTGCNEGVIDFTNKDKKHNTKFKKEIIKGTKNAAPSDSAIEKWSANHYWLLRRQALREHLKEVAHENFESRLVEKANSIADKIFRNIELMLNKQYNRLCKDDEDYNAYHNKADAEAVNISMDTIEVSRGWLTPEDVIETQDEEDVYIEPVDLESDEFMERELEFLERMVEKR